MPSRRPRFRAFHPALAALGISIVISASFAAGRVLRAVSGRPLRALAASEPLREAGLGTAFTFTQSPPDESSPAETFQDVYRYIKSDYVDRVDDDQRLSNFALRTMLNSLDDPSTRYYDPAERRQLMEQLNGLFPGIGATLAVVKQKHNGIDQRRLGVVAPVPGGPADRAGLRPGDVISYVNSKWVIAYNPRQDLDRLHLKDMTEQQYRQAWKDASRKFTEGLNSTAARDLLLGKDGQTLTLTIDRPGAPAPIKTTLTTGATSLSPVEYHALSGRLGYLRVTQFSDSAAEKIAAALGSRAPEALVVDLRGNSGGPVPSNRRLPAAAVALLDNLTRGGQVGVLQTRAAQREAIQIPAGAPKTRRIAVLVNGGTANVAELVAAALKEKAGASLIGARTFGDAVYQKLFTLRNSAAMTVASGRLLTASGQEFGGAGLKPDVLISTGGPSADDEAVRRAAALLGA